MGSITVNRLAWARPGGAPLFEDVSFHVNEGAKVGLVGANGVGKTTLVRLISGDAAAAGEAAQEGTISIEGRLGIMRQLVGSIRDETTVRDLCIALAPARFATAARRLADAEHKMLAVPTDTDAATRYASRISEWGEAGGYEEEARWDASLQRAVGDGLDTIGERRMATFSGGEQKRIALELLLRGDHDVLLLDEPDNFLDVAGKRWLEEELRKTAKTVLFVSHDRELLAGAATKIVTIEAHGAWTHGGSFSTYHDARVTRMDKLAHDRSVHDAERERLVEIVKEMRVRAKISATFAPRLQAAESRLRQFDEREDAPPEIAKEQKVAMKLRGGRTGKKALTMEALSLDGLTDPFDGEIWFGERVAVLGANGAGKSHFLRLVAGDPSVAHTGSLRLGARVVPGHFNQTHDQPELHGQTLLQLLEKRDVVLGPAMGMLRRYELAGCAEQNFETLSGGQQARFQILLLELGGATLLLLDEPTDNLDLGSAEALESALAEFEGTVVAVTHDRWFLRGFDRFLVFEDDCKVRDLMEPPPRWT